MNKWMTIPDMGYLTTSIYIVVLVCLSLKQNIMIFSLRAKPLVDVSSHRIICIGLVHGSYFI